jgi:hypothetical protein
MSLILKTGDKEIIESGSVITFGDDSMEVELTMFNLTPNPVLFFLFLKDPNAPEQRIEVNVSTDNLKLEIKLYNFENSLDSGNGAPLEIGVVNGKKISLNFRIRKIGESRTIDYTFYKLL